MQNLLQAGRFVHSDIRNFGNDSEDFAAIVVIRHGAAGAAKWFEREREFSAAGSEGLVPKKLTLSHLTKVRKRINMQLLSVSMPMAVTGRRIAPPVRSCIFCDNYKMEQWKCQFQEEKSET